MRNDDINIPEVNSNTKSKKCYVPKRYILVLLGSWGVFNVFALRTNLSVAMVAMVNFTTTTTANDSFQQADECPNLLNRTQQSSHGSHRGEKYEWDIKTQSTILGSFFYSYVVSQLPGGILAEMFGAKWLFGCGILGTSILTMLTPTAASWGSTALITVRVLEGFGEGVTFPAISYAVSVWSPKTERSKISSIIFSGGMIGNVVAMSASGIMCNSEALGGWPSVFYVFGSVGCLWFVLWCFLIHETPGTHPGISKEELLYIEQNKDERQRKKPPIPWKDISTSVPVWAMIVAHFGNNFGFLMMLSEMPSYLSTALHFDIKSNGVLSAIPYVAQLVGALLSSYLADKLRQKNTFSITTIRKIFNSIGMFGPAFCLIGVTLSGCRPVVIVVLLILGIGMNGSFFSGVNVTMVDMCPEFAGTLYGLSNGIACLTGFLGPMAVGTFTSKGATLSNWNKVFYTTAALNIFSGTVFVIFGSAALQTWSVIENKYQEDQTSKKEQIVSEPH